MPGTWSKDYAPKWTPDDHVDANRARRTPSGDDLARIDDIHWQFCFAAWVWRATTSVLVCILYVIIAVGACNSLDAESWKQYRDSKFSFRYPSSWTEKHENGVVWVTTSKDDAPDVWFRTVPSDSTELPDMYAMESLYRSLAKEIQLTVAPNKLINQGRDSIGGEDAISIGTELSSPSSLHRFHYVLTVAQFPGSTDYLFLQSSGYPSNNDRDRAYVKAIAATVVFGVVSEVKPGAYRAGGGPVQGGTSSMVVNVQSGHRGGGERLWAARYF
jgi:hypothetical protein